MLGYIVYHEATGRIYGAGMTLRDAELHSREGLAEHSGSGIFWSVAESALVDSVRETGFAVRWYRDDVGVSRLKR